MGRCCPLCCVAAWNERALSSHPPACYFCNLHIACSGICLLNSSFLVPAGYDPVVNVNVHTDGRYAFVELRTPDMASASLQLNGQVGRRLLLLQGSRVVLLQASAKAWVLPHLLMWPSNSGQHTWRARLCTSCSRATLGLPSPPLHSCRCNCWAPRCPLAGPADMWTRARRRPRPRLQLRLWLGSR